MYYKNHDVFKNLPRDFYTCTSRGQRASCQSQVSLCKMQVMRFGSKHLYPLSPLTVPSFLVLFLTEKDAV